MRKPSLIAAGLMLAAAVPAHASGALICESLDKQASVSIGMGRLPIVHVLGIDIEANGKRWSTTKDKDVIPVANGQAFASDEQYYFDITDDNVEGVVARLRVLFGRAEDVDAEPVFVGYLSIKGEGVWPVTCSTE